MHRYFLLSHPFLQATVIALTWGWRDTAIGTTRIAEITEWYDIRKVKYLKGGVLRQHTFAIFFMSDNLRLINCCELLTSVEILC